MAHIGAFTRTAGGYRGRLQTLPLDGELTLVPANAGNAGKAPDFRIHLGAGTGGPEAGVGGKRTGENVRAGRTAAAAIVIAMLGAPIAMPFASPANSESNPGY